MRQVVLLRGVNVGGAGRLKMAELRAALEAEGATSVATYIQSGNLVLHHDAEGAALNARVAEAVERVAGFRPAVLSRSAGAFQRLLDGNPFPEVADPKKLYAHLFDGTAPGDVLDRLAPQARRGETLALREGVLWLDAPEGIGRSALAARIEPALGLPCTARNLNTMRAIADML